jgi:hypothetical protein
MAPLPNGQAYCGADRLKICQTHKYTKSHSKSFSSMVGEYNVWFEHIAGQKNIVADALDSEFWLALWCLVGTSVHMGAARHQQTDGQSERTVKTIKQTLKMYLNKTDTNWLQWLPLAEFWYNSVKHSSIYLLSCVLFCLREAPYHHFHNFVLLEK